jgi:hypothetical protein
VSQRDSGRIRQKKCKYCGKLFRRVKDLSHLQWRTQTFCSNTCAIKCRSTHGMRHTRLYRVWAGIKTRCYNKNDPLFKYYGKREIKMYPKWKNDFALFAKYMMPDLGNRFEIGRIKTNRGYTPGNVQWETRKQNMRNTRKTRWVSYFGKRVSLAEACELANVNYKRTWVRFNRGLSLKEAML